jgi:hypothetical protein
MAKFELKVPKDKKVIIKSLGLELRGGEFYQQKVLRAVYEAGYTSFVDKVAPKKKDTKDDTKKKVSDD